MAGRFSVEAIFTAKDKITAPIRKMQTGVKRFTQSASKGLGKVNRMAKKMGDGFKRAAFAVVAGAAIIGRAFADVVTKGADFGRALGSAAAKFVDMGPKTDRQGEKFKALAAAAREVGAQTEFTATQAAEGLNFMAKAGFTAEDSIKSLRSIVDFATASEMELAEAADIASDALGAFGLTSKDSDQQLLNLKRVMDVMSKTANSTNTSVAELFETMVKGAPVAAQAGVSIETFSATMGILASSGIKAGVAGTAAKNITLALAGVGNQAADSFEALGIQLQQGGKMRDQLDVLDELREKMQGLGELEQTNLIAGIFGKIPVAAASVIMADTTNEIRNMRDVLEDAKDSAGDTAAFIRNDVRGSLDSLSSAVEGVKISIFSMNESALKDAIDLTTTWVRTNEQLIAGRLGEWMLFIITNMGDIVKWTKRIAIGVAIFITLTTVLKTVALILTVVNLLMLANPITLMVLGVMLLIAAITALVVWFDTWTAWLRDVDGWVKILITGLAFLVGGPIALFIGAAALIMSAWEPIKQLFEDIGNSEVGKRISAFFSFGTDEEGAAAAGGAAGSAQVVSPQERAGRSVDEQRTTDSSEVTIRDETGKAEVTKRPRRRGSVRLQQSGAF